MDPSLSGTTVLRGDFTKPNRTPTGDKTGEVLLAEDGKLRASFSYFGRKNGKKIEKFRKN